MHDVLRQRLIRRLESLPEAQLYQVLDYVEFLESKYADRTSGGVSGLQKLAENLEDRMRKKAMNPATLREAFQVIAAADRVLSGVSNAGKQLLNELVPEDAPPRRSAPGPTGERPRSGTSDSDGSAGTGEAGFGGEGEARPTGADG